MNKIAQYLNEHILGEATSSEPVRQQFSRDGSILSITPEMVVSPRVTNDIRKVARFTWQLAEKGHILPITVRGGGTDQTGASIGKGIVINTLAHLNNIIYISTKNKDQFAHVQPGVNFGTLNDVLNSHGMTIPTFPSSFRYSTIGGAVANNAGGQYSGRYGSTGDYVTRLEVILANGDLIETKRINRRELDKKKGLQTFEGEIYRKIDGLIEDNEKIINNQIDAKQRDNTGYSGIAKVKERDGSFDLTPLFIGSQGTLGILSEIVLKTDFYNSSESVIVATFDNPETARDAADILSSLEPASLDVIDGEIFNIARSTYGKKYAFSDAKSDNGVGAVLFISFDDFNDGARRRKVKNLQKKLKKLNTVSSIFTNDNLSTDELYAIREVSSIILQPETKGESLSSIIDGVSIPAARREEFILALDDLSQKNHVSLPLQIQWLDGVIHARPLLQLHQISDKQKAFKLISDYMELVIKCGGCTSAQSGEGRQKTVATYAQLDKEILSLYEQTRLVFDPYGTLNPGVKQSTELKSLIADLNPDSSLGDFAKYSPKF